MTRATFWRQATEGTAYWRCEIPARHLPGRMNYVSQIDKGDQEVIRQEGVAVWQFLGDLELTSYAAAIQTSGVKCLMEVDDNYLIPAPHMPGRDSAWATTIMEAMKTGKRYSLQAHRMILPSIDGMIVSTDELAARYEPLVPAGVIVCPNSVDPDDWPSIEGREHRMPVVGYAGSDSHLYDLAIVERALDWASRHTTLAKIGVSTKTWRWKHREIPWTDDLAQYRRNLQLIDIGLCPLKRGDWHDSKSDIKAMEYLMAGAVPIVQADSPCYRDWIGLVPSASTPKEWEKTVKEVVLMREGERYSVWKRAYEWLLEHKTISKHIAKWREATA